MKRTRFLPFSVREGEDNLLPFSVREGRRERERREEGGRDLDERRRNRSVRVRGRPVGKI